VNTKTKIGLFILLALLMFPAYSALPQTTETGERFPTLAPMIDKVHPAVVNISTYSSQRNNYNPLFNDPFFRRFFNIPDQEQLDRQPKRRQRSAGSGVIVDAQKGIVMTNHHVIKNADEVVVSLADGRSFDAKILGEDADLDIAILEIEDAENLVQVKIADSSELKVGDFVVAIGNPFGLGQTVTTGIVSALGRTGLGIEGYENFIQTDASINPGNSGGALVNLAGELVGINTAIIAPSGGNVGIGFAIPSNMASASLQQILEHGKVTRGQIGIGIQDVTPDLRKAFNLENGQGGVLVANVLEDSPAEKAKLKSGDIIIEVDGKSTSSAGQLRSQIGMKAIGDKVTLTILRDGDKKKIKVAIGDPESFAGLSGQLPELLEGVQLQETEDGVLVSNLSANSPAAYSGLRRGDVIVGANRRKVTDLKSLEKALSQNDSTILLQVNRRGGSLFIVIR
jgi:Do/DeqQ family serine protease